MIGLFDSGSGGLSVLSALRERVPHADVVYFGDIKNAPYGIRSQEELAALTVAGIEILKNMGATEIVSACNSVSPAVLSGAAGNIPTIEMTAPTAQAMRTYAGKRVLLIATPATILSEIYQHSLGGIISLDPLPIPELAGAIEFGENDKRIAQIVRDSLVERKRNSYDLLLLGCTHYPLAKEIIEQEAGRVFGKIRCIDPAGFVAGEAAKTFNCNGAGALRFRISKDSPQFRERVAKLFPSGGYTIRLI